MNEREQTLTEAYWKVRDHAREYRKADVVHAARQKWEASGRRDEVAHHRVLVHEWFARGVEAAARDIADLLGVCECDIELPQPANHTKEQQ